MSEKRHQAINLTEDDLKSANNYFIENFSGNERVEWHYETMFSLVNPALAVLPKNRVPDHLTDFRIRWMFAVSAWNKRSYQSNKRDPLDHFHRIEAPFRKHWVALMGYRERNVLSLSDDDKFTIISIFGDFRPILGPVGTAKGLHLFAPNFFSPWDTRIYKGYEFNGYQPLHYWQFLEQTHEQIKRLEGHFGDENPIKVIDRFNFWHFTRNRGE